MKFLRIILTLVVSGAIGPAAMAQKPAADASTKPAPAVAASNSSSTAMKVQVISVEGVAQKGTPAPDGEKIIWSSLQAGDKLSELDIVRTGLGARVVLRFDDRGEMTIKNVTKIGIGEFRKRGSHVNTKLGLKYGSVRAKVDSSRGTNSFSIATPVAVASVRGTKGALGFAGDVGLGLAGSSGTWHVAANDGRGTNVDAGGQTNSNLATTRTLDSRQLDTQMGAADGGLTGTEKKNLMFNGGGRGVFGFDGGTPFGAGTFNIPDAPKSSCQSSNDTSESSMSAR